MAARNRFAEACCYGIAVVGMQDQWLLVALTEIGDVPAPQLVWAVSPQARHCPRCLRWSCPTPPLALSCLVQDPIKAGLRANVVALIGQCWHDLPRWQRGVFRLIAGEQDSLAFHLTQAMRNQTRTALTAVLTVSVTRKGTPPAHGHFHPAATEPGCLAVPGAGLDRPSPRRGDAITAAGSLSSAP